MLAAGICSTRLWKHELGDKSETNLAVVLGRRCWRGQVTALAWRGTRGQGHLVRRSPERAMLLPGSRIFSLLCQCSLCDIGQLCASVPSSVMSLPW